MKHFLISLIVLMGISSCSNKNKLTVDYGALSPNDFEIYLSIFPEIRDKPIYKDGVYYDVPNEYGENDWVIIYKDQQQCKFRHFKTNRRHTHKYKFVVSEKQDTIYCDVDIRGKNSLKHAFNFTAIE